MRGVKHIPVGTATVERNGSVDGTCGVSIARDKSGGWLVYFDGYPPLGLQTLLFGYPAAPPMRLRDSLWLDAGSRTAALGLRELLEEAILIVTGGGR